MKILITGAAGGIGSTLCHDLSKLQHEILLVDNLRNGYMQNIDSDENLLQRFHRLDICSDDFYNLVGKERPDLIVHLAAVTSLPDCEVNKGECLRINVEGTSKVLAAAAKFGIKRVIFASTSAVYENTEFKNDGFRETDDISPRLFYSLSKKMSEEICASYIQNYNLDIIMLRLFNVFGPRQDIYRKNPPLINYIMRQLYRNEPLILHSNGEQKRDYVYVDDVVKTIEACMNLQVDFGKDRTFNVCSGASLSVRDIVAALKTLDTKFSYVSEIYRNSSMLWNEHPILFDGVYSLDKAVIAKEAEKKSLGNNQLFFKKFGWQPSKDLNLCLLQTGREILNNLQKRNNDNGK
jgi:nucleoside-diphosphate-sugar epimerase